MCFFTLRFEAFYAHEAAIQESSLALFIKGPTFDGRVLEEEDWLVELEEMGTQYWLARYRYLEWSYPLSFVGHYKIRESLSLWKLPPQHPLILPHLAMAMGQFRGELKEKTENRRVYGLERIKALHSFACRFQSFIGQAHKEAARQTLGEPFTG